LLGEGEHKIMQYIRDLRSSPNYEPNLRHCMYGQDADLIMLGLASHEPHFALLREVIHFQTFTKGRKSSSREVVMRQTKEAQFQLLHLSVLREYIIIDFAHHIHHPIEQERIIDDFIFLTFLVGNDFLPHLPTLDISEHAFDVLINAYRDLFQENPGYIVDHGELADLQRLEKLFAVIGSKEEEILSNRETELKKFAAKRRKRDEITEEDEAEAEELEEFLQQQFEEAWQEAMHGDSFPEAILEEFTIIGKQGKKKKLPFSSAPITAESGSGEMPSGQDADFGFGEDDDEEEGEEGGEGNERKKKDYRGRYYYEKFKFVAIGKEGESQLTDIMKHYLKGLQWCLAYYIKGCISWTWYYPFHYGPMLQDMKNLSVLSSSISFDLGQPFTPFQQLLGCLPPASSILLPKCYAWLMTNSDSPIIDFYPLDFGIDQDGKKNPWEAVVLLSFIDEKKLLEAESLHCPLSKLTKTEIHRNRFGKLITCYFDLSGS
jgi:5'-3' exoribonuclease 1